MLHFRWLLPTPAEEEAVAAIGGDDAILLGDRRFHSDRHYFLAVVKVAETADQLRFVERIGDDLHSTHHRHVSKEGYELFGGGSDAVEAELPSRTLLDSLKTVIKTSALSKLLLQLYINHSLLVMPWIQKRRLEYVKHEHLEIDILRHVQRHVLRKLLAEDGTPNVSTIRRLFEKVDQDGDKKITFSELKKFLHEIKLFENIGCDKDNCISQSELKQLVMNIKFRNMPLEADEAVEKIMEELDINGDKVLNEEEFVVGFSKWLNTANNQTPNSIESVDEIKLKKWEETDMSVEDRRVDTSPWAWIKAIMLLVVGIALAEPLIHSVQYFSKSASIPSFFIAFIIVPLATNARGSISAIKAAS
ncbi:Sodium/calcium exchanger NCL1 [Camellia lanceoleosa]|uniref:Sodium/calcium exchanger NCL1 n=1 Tax=Camellia lanceoleosa TaxID=1840588 RepID=A0ACC0HBR9_9ERIC|nr:Sodium/calcium exchanger NCL1 [Camellia lanceoleosa]